jgi:hypothetical protein
VQEKNYGVRELALAGAPELPSMTSPELPWALHEVSKREREIGEEEGEEG